MSDDELLAAVLRRFVTADGYWYVGDGMDAGRTCQIMTIDATVELSDDERAAIERVFPDG